MRLNPKDITAKVFFIIALIATFYHIYLIIHPHTPISYYYRIGILDLTQLQRATHVFFILILGYLLLYIRGGEHSLSLGLRWLIALILAVLSLIPTYLAIEWLIDNEALIPALYVLLVWFTTLALPVLEPLSRIISSMSRYASLLTAILTTLPYTYLIINYEELIYRTVIPHPWDIAMGWTITLMLFGIVLRYIGPELPILTNIFILYNIYGYMLPRPWYHPGFDIDFLVAKIYSETEGALFGIITNVSLIYIAYFTILAGVLAALGYGDILARAFFTLLGRDPASPGRVSVGLGLGMGMISGSGAADTAFIGSTMRHIFKAAGYPDLTAAGIMANAGTLAIITPPILGAAAFVMVEILNIPYTWVIIMAIVPALLYVLSILLYNEYYVRGANIRPVDVQVTRRFNIRFLIPFVPVIIILSLIFQGYTVRLAVTIALIASIILALLDKELRPNIRNLPNGFVNGIRLLIPIGASITAANVIMAMVVVSGLHQKFTLALLSLLGGNLAYAIIFASVFSLILGLGVPPTATYVLSSVLTAPAIVKLAVASGIPETVALLATHMFLFYMAMLADITPPVGLSNFAIAAIYNLNPIRVGVKAALVAIPKYLYAPSIIWSYWGASILILPIALTASMQETILLVTTRLAAIIAGTWFISMANAGYYGRNKPLPLLGKILLYIFGTMLIIPSEKLNLASLILGLSLLVLLELRSRKVKTSM
ncbi:MAG: TRAP transporter large permease subunit [Acidilobaceae archaeon]